MATTHFVNGSVVEADWLNDVNDVAYGEDGNPYKVGSGSSLIGFTQSGTGAVARTMQDKGREVVSVKDFGAVGDGVADDTAEIQAAITAAAGQTLYFPEGTYIISDSLVGVSNLTIVFDPGVTVQIAAGSSVTTGDAILYFNECSRVMLLGNGAKLIGERKGTGANDIVQGIALCGCSDVYVEKFLIYDCAGDGVLIQGAADNTPIYSERIVVRDVLSSNCMRNGFAVTSCIDGLLENCVAHKTNGKDPKAGYDIEPEGGSTRMQNVRLVNCVATDNEAFDFSLVLGGNVTPVTNSVGVELINCVARDSRTYTTTIGYAVLNHRDTMANDGYVRLVNCKAMNVNNHGLMVRNIDKDGQDVEIIDMELVDTALTSAVNMVSGQDTPFILYTNTAISSYADPGGVRIHGLRVIDNTRDRTPYYISSAGTAWVDVVITDLDWIDSVGETSFPYMDAGTDALVTWVGEPYQVNRTSNITLSTRYSGWKLTNLGAGGAVVFTLPAISACFPWTYFDFFVRTAQILRIDPNASDKIHVFGTGDGKYVDASAIGVWVRIKYHDADGWIMQTNRESAITAEP